MQTWGVGTFIIGLLMIWGGLTGWTSTQKTPVFYEQKRIVLTEHPMSYDSWVNQLQRKKERGR
jgi:hypothetical protein